MLSFMLAHRVTLATLVLTVLASAPTIAAEELTRETFDAWRDYIGPKDEELRWKDIPWRPSLWQAVIDAQHDRKPILLWVMNGHPMGCT